MSKTHLGPIWVYIIIGFLLGILSVSCSAFLSDARTFLALIDVVAIIVAAIAGTAAAFCPGVRGLAERLTLVFISFASTVYIWGR